MSKLLLLASFASAAFSCSSDYSIWIPRSQSADPLYRFLKGGKAGYIDATGRVVISPRFELSGNSGGEFHDGFVEIGVFDGIYANRTGKVVLNKGLFRGWDFSEGLAVAMRKGENLWGYIDTTGEFVIPPQFATSPSDYVYPFSDGLAMVEVRGRFGYIDKSGKFAILPHFLDGTSFADGVLSSRDRARTFQKADVDSPIPSFQVPSCEDNTTHSVKRGTSIRSANSRSRTGQDVSFLRVLTMCETSPKGLHR